VQLAVFSALTKQQVDQRDGVCPDPSLTTLQTQRLTRLSGVYSILTPRSFAILFMFGDFVCLVIQGTGGGLAGTAIDNAAANNGALIMTGGVVVQRECNEPLGRLLAVHGT
jgi:hypothetical protein